MSDTKELQKLRDKYQAKADSYWHDYQIDGQTSQLRSFERNERMADALTDALNGSKIKDRYYDLKSRIVYIDADDTENAIKALKAI